MADFQYLAPSIDDLDQAPTLVHGHEGFGLRAVDLLPVPDDLLGVVGPNALSSQKKSAVSRPKIGRSVPGATASLRTTADFHG